MIRNLLFCGAFFLSIILLAVAAWAMTQQVDLLVLFKAAVGQIFISHYSNFNLYYSGMIEGTNVMAAFQLLMLAALVLTMAGLGLIHNFKSDFQLEPLKVLIVCWITALMAFGFLQEMKRIEVFVSAARMFAGKNVEERLAWFFGPSYVFAQECGKKLKQPLNVEFLTDADMNKDPYMSEQRRLAYYFYPMASLRLRRDGPVDGKFYFYKNGLPGQLPEEFAVVCATHDKNFILAVKKDKIHDYVNP